MCLDRIRRTLRNESGVWEKFGVGPASIPDYLALVGDSADGFPGIKGWGAKSTATVLAQYTHLEKIPADAADWEIAPRGAARLAENLAVGREDAALFKVLATLRTDVPLEEELADLHWRGAHRADLEAFCAEIGDTGLTGDVSGWLE